MAFIWADSFDFYTTTNFTNFTVDMATYWDTAIVGSMSVNTATSRFGVGVYPGMSAIPTTALVKASASNDAGHHVVLAYRHNSATLSGNGFTITFFDGTTAQCSIVIDPFVGTIYLKSGLGAGAVLATFAAGLSGNVWYGMEFEVVINNTTGSFKVRLNGNTADDFSATGLNTRATANNYANKIQLGVTQNTGAGYSFDDFLWFSTTGAAPNTWVGDIRAQQLMPVSDASVGLSSSTGTSAFVTGVTNANGTASANLLTSSAQGTVTYGGTATNIGMQWTGSYTGKYKLGLYDGTTNALLGQTTEQINAVAGVVSLPLLASVVLATGSKFYIGLLNDTLASSSYASSNGVISHADFSAAYTSGMPSSLTTFSSLGSRVLQPATVTIVTNNNSQVTQATEDGDTTFVYGSTAGVGDLYNIALLGATPSSIVAVQTRMCARKSDTGFRQARVQVKSGATTSNGTTVTLGTGYSYQGAKVDTVDPNTGAAWTAAGVNGLLIGVQVVT